MNPLAERLEPRQLLATWLMGAESHVNTFTTSFQSTPSVALTPAGDYVVTYYSLDQDGSGSGIYARRFDKYGLPLGTEFLVNDYTTGNQSGPQVAIDADGDFVVIWSGPGPGDTSGIFAQRFNSNGVEEGTQFRINEVTAFPQVGPAVAMMSTGEFVVTWMSERDGSGYGIYARKFDAAGVPTGSEFRVNTTTAFDQVGPAIAVNDVGEFVVVWENLVTTPAVAEIHGQRFNAAGLPVGSEFQANTYTSTAQRSPHVAIDPAGDFAVVWTSFNQDGDSYGVYHQRYSAAGTPLGFETRVNVLTTGRQEGPSIAKFENGDYIISWANTSWGE